MKIGIVAILSPLEIPYVKEWLEYHCVLGITDAFLFLNDWTDEQALELDKLIRSIPIYVRKIRFDGLAKQLPAYNEGIRMCLKQGIDWAAFIDVDEFLRIRSNRRLKQILQQRSQMAQLSVNWRLFGSNGLEKVEDIYDPDPLSITERYSVLQRFTKCESKLNQHVKQIVNVQLFREKNLPIPHFMNPHFTNYLSFSTDGFPVRGPFNMNHLDEVHELELNHYRTKSREECRIRRSFRRVDTGGMLEEGWESFFKEYDKNDIEEQSLVF